MTGRCLGRVSFWGCGFLVTICGEFIYEEIQKIQIGSLEDWRIKIPSGIKRCCWHHDVCFLFFYGGRLDYIALRKILLEERVFVWCLKRANEGTTYWLRRSTWKVKQQRTFERSYFVVSELFLFLLSYFFLRTKVFVSSVYNFACWISIISSLHTRSRRILEGIQCLVISRFLWLVYFLVMYYHQTCTLFYWISSIKTVSSPFSDSIFESSQNLLFSLFFNVTYWSIF